VSAIPTWVWLLAAAAPPITVLGTLAALTCIGGTKTRRAQNWPTADERDYGWPPTATTHSRWDSRGPGVHINRWTADGPAEQQEW
jgi:hypothetical protein